MDVPRHAIAGRIALLTTRFPGDDESERRIIGAMLIESISLDTNWGPSTIVRGDPRFSLRAPVDALFRYWDFKAGSRRWHEHLYRYISDVEVANYLRALHAMLTDPRTKAIVDRQLEAIQ